jgi:hypothetical protein
MASIGDVGVRVICDDDDRDRRRGADDRVAAHLALTDRQLILKLPLAVTTVPLRRKTFITPR